MEKSHSLRAPYHWHTAAPPNQLSVTVAGAESRHQEQLGSIFVEHKNLVTMARSFVALLAVAGMAALAPMPCHAWTEVWPLPQVFNTGNQLAYIGPDFIISCANPGACPNPLPAAIERYIDIIFFAGPPVPPPAGANIITGLEINVGAAAELEYGVCENYTLSVPLNSTAVLSAPNQWGALRGLESFSQLMLWGTPNGTSQYTIDAAPVSIVDWPRWGWRSLLIDSSRHFLPVSAIKATMDAMSYTKFNTVCAREIHGARETPTCSCCCCC